MKGIVFFIVALLLLAQCTSQPQKAETVAAKTEYPDQESWQTTIYITREGKTIGCLQAGHVRKYSKKKITLLDQNITVDFFNEEGKHTSRLTAQGGKIFDTSQDMLAYGRVHVVSDSGLTLATDTLRWDNRRQKILSTIPMVLTTENHDTLYGDGFESDANLDNYVITNPHGKSSRSIQIK